MRDQAPAPGECWRVHNLFCSFRYKTDQTTAHLQNNLYGIADLPREVCSHRAD